MALKRNILDSICMSLGYGNLQRDRSSAWWNVLKSKCVASHQQNRIQNCSWAEATLPCTCATNSMEYWSETEESATSSKAGTTTSSSELEVSQQQMPSSLQQRSARSKVFEFCEKNFNVSVRKVNHVFHFVKRNSTSGAHLHKDTEIFFVLFRVASRPGVEVPSFYQFDMLYHATQHTVSILEIKLQVGSSSCKLQICSFPLSGTTQEETKRDLSDARTWTFPRSVLANLSKTSRSSAFTKISVLYSKDNPSGSWNEYKLSDCAEWQKHQLRNPTSLNFWVTSMHGWLVNWRWMSGNFFSHFLSNVARVSARIAWNTIFQSKMTKVAVPFWYLRTPDAIHATLADIWLVPLATLCFLSALRCRERIVTGNFWKYFCPQFAQQACKWCAPFDSNWYLRHSVLFWTCAPKTRTPAHLTVFTNTSLLSGHLFAILSYRFCKDSPIADPSRGKSSIPSVVTGSSFAFCVVWRKQHSASVKHQDHQSTAQLKHQCNYFRALTHHRILLGWVVVQHVTWVYPVWSVPVVIQFLCTPHTEDQQKYLHGVHLTNEEMSIETGIPTTKLRWRNKKTRMLRIKSVWSHKRSLFINACLIFWKTSGILTDHFSKSGSNPPLDLLYTYGWTDIQTDGDYIKRVVTPFGTTRLITRI